jgi:LacI family transcriptional regulator
MSDVARRAGVSLGTVSRVLNNHRAVNATMRARVTEAMAQLGYEPDALARSMRTRVTKSIGCMVPDISVPFFSQSIGAAEQVLYDHGYTVTLSNTYEHSKRETELLSFFRRRRVDALIAAVYSNEDEAALGTIQEFPVPVVLLQHPGKLAIDSVGADYRDAVTKSLDHLFGLGHTRIGIVIGRTGLPGAERASAFANFHKTMGIEFNPAHVHFCGLSQELAYIRTYEMMSSSQPPSAIIGGSTQMIGILKALRALHVPIPEKVSLISIGDSDATALYEPGITAIRWDYAELGRSAAHLLMQRLSKSGPTETISYMISGDLILRGSCAPVRALATVSR